jgi:hypothetical protein
VHIPADTGSNGCIRSGRPARSEYVRSLGRDQLDWLIQPLQEAGVEPEEIRRLLFRLCFETTVCEGLPDLGAVHAVAHDQEPGVRTAWAHTIGRLMTLQDPVGAP